MGKFPIFREGPAKRPDIQHDHGFLDNGHNKIDPSKRKSPTMQDYKALARWRAKLLGAAALRVDLVDAIPAYAHFLDGSGTDLEVDYEKFLSKDPSGQTVLKSAIADTVASAVALHDAKMGSLPKAATQDQLNIISEKIAVTSGDLRYPYPETENWQKTLGAHYIWIDAIVKVKVDPLANKRSFEVSMNLHVEDMYNFNPRNKDIATGIADSENGRFEITGLAHEFLTKAQITRSITFSEPIACVVDARLRPADQNVSGAPQNGALIPVTRSIGPTAASSGF